MSSPSLAFLGDPVVIDDPNEAAKVEHIRRVVFGGAISEPTKHLGEAETCHLILNRADFRGSRWITDDRDAIEYAAHQGIPTWESQDLMSEAVSVGIITEHDGFDLLIRMKNADRGLRVPAKPVDLRR